jgi:hypothetical protein
MVSDQNKVYAGIALLAVSTIALLAAAMVDLSMPIALAAVATTGLAVGSLLVGTSGEGHPV